VGGKFAANIQPNYCNILNKRPFLAEDGMAKLLTLGCRKKENRLPFFHIRSG
jgi:hypothetical protein